ncbi:PREDICTED: homeobox protein knotted-1-like 1 isoform X2 [Nelumbo nucifera]|uniref:KNOX1 domain-containing protein n=2 Tax=Nelumbo nucifera TaxID=4432 RepID=A0A822YL14_NELNU|nr:PREDICTED: homeobox protein knotted-1-like 1 isoform X2 [Nelumbo nucifera]DAD32271.1 TPA_asm: hypothetical protein HUJ06_011122 [Nelumbo nucifera]
MEANSNKNVNVSFLAEEDGEDEEVLKRRISCHPLYGLLIETHLDCLKVSLGDIGEASRNAFNPDIIKSDSSMSYCSDLDHFMERKSVGFIARPRIQEPILSATWKNHASSRRISWRCTSTVDCIVGPTGELLQRWKMLSCQMVISLLKVTSVQLGMDLC